MEIESATRERGFDCPSAVSNDQVRSNMFRLTRQQALFAYVDTLAETILTCVPEPPADTKTQAVAQPKNARTAAEKCRARHGWRGEASNAGNDTFT